MEKEVDIKEEYNVKASETTDKEQAVKPKASSRKKHHTFPLHTLKKIIWSNNIRCSKKSLLEFNRQLEELSIEISHSATNLAKHSKRNTVKKDDIIKAVKILRGEKSW